ncbi:hypothetical protein ES707_04053 [subsurface metagenome]
MEVKQDSCNQAAFDEMRQIARDNVCAECGAELQIHTDPEKKTLVVGCLNREHHGWVERVSYTQALRRGEEIHPAIRDNIEKKMLPREDLTRAMNLLALRYPKAVENPESAALFIYDCLRLDLDPLISPAEAVPIPFRGGGRVTVQMVITGDGWLSMAARGCPDDWMGPPRLERIQDKEEIESLCGDPDAWAYYAYGYTKKTQGQPVESLARVPGYFTVAEREQAQEHGLPAAREPGNQARWRAIKKWVRQTFPDCRQSMIAITKEWFQRAEGVQAATEFIDAEYQIFEDAPSTDNKDKVKVGGDGRATEEGGGMRRTAKTKETKSVQKKSGKAGPPAPGGSFPRDPSTIKDFGDLYTACMEDFGLNKSQVLAELNVSSQEELTELPADCYIRIASVRT